MSQPGPGGKTKNIQNAVVSTYVHDQLSVRTVYVEVCVATGIPTFQIVGLPEKAVKESRERVKAAMMNSGYVFPVKKILVNLSPADMPKSGGYFDLPIALAILIASGQVQRRQHMSEAIWAGELSLLGKVVGKHLLAFAITAFREKSMIVLPEETPLPSILSGENIHLVRTLQCAVKRLEQGPLSNRRTQSMPKEEGQEAEMGFGLVSGRQWEKIAMVLAAAGGHHLLLQGPPGVGKTLLAQCYASIIPDLTIDQMLEVALIYSWVGQARLDTKVPVRMPHHHITPCALLGGGVPFGPGEISLAHHGVLFLDEITEYHRGLLDQLREALTQGEVNISRASRKVTVSAGFQLLVAMNPCPCGYFGNGQSCICGHLEIKKHQKSISGPFLDRIDMGVVLHQSPQYMPSGSKYISEKLYQRLGCLEDSTALKLVVNEVRQIQLRRQQVLNKELSWRACQQEAQKARDADNGFSAVELKCNLGGRGWQKTMRVARTVADCEGEVVLQSRHFEMAAALAIHRF